MPIPLRCQVIASLSKPDGSKQQDVQSTPPVKKQSFVRDYLELACVPLAFAVLIAGITWAVWFLTSAACTPELAKTTGCGLSGLGKYMNLDLFNKMVVHGGIAGGFGSIGSYVVITRERQRADAAELRATEERNARLAAEQQLAIERQRADDARQRADDARRKADEAKDLYIKKLEELVAQNHNGDHTSALRISLTSPPCP